MATRAKGDVSGAVRIGMFALWGISYIAARVGIEVLEPGTLRTALAVLPALPFVGVLWVMFRGIANADELERRIHLEALALAFPLTMLMLMVLGLLDLAVDLNPDNWSYRHVWQFMVVFWLLGLVIARRRYA